MNIPNFVDMKIVGENGHFTPEWKIIMQQLLSTLKNNASDEGLVAPTQNAADINIIQTNQVYAPVLITPQYSCQYGTMIYNSDGNSLMVALNNGLGAPQFYTVVTI